MTTPPFGTGYSFSDTSSFFEKLRQKRIQEQQRQQQRLADARKRIQASRDAQRIREQYEQGNVTTALGPAVTPTPGQYLPVPPSTAKDTYVKNLNTSNPGLIDYGNFFGSGVLENITEAGITTLGKLEPALNTAAAGIASLIPGDQEFDKQLRAVVKEREEAGKPGGLRGVFASRTEAARRAEVLQRGSEYGASVALAALPDNLFGTGIDTDALNNKRKKYFEEFTGEEWSFANSIKYWTDDLRATRQAYLEVEQPKYVKGVLEFFGDPINLFSGGSLAEVTAAYKIIKAGATKSAQLAAKPLGYSDFLKGDNTIKDNVKNANAATDPDIQSEIAERFVVDSPLAGTRSTTVFDPDSDIISKLSGVKSASKKQSIFTDELHSQTLRRISETTPDVLIKVIRQANNLLDNLGLSFMTRTTAYATRLINPKFVASVGRDKANLRNLQTTITIAEQKLKNLSYASSQSLLTKLGKFDDVFKINPNKVGVYINDIQDGMMQFNKGFNKKIFEQAAIKELNLIKSIDKGTGAKQRVTLDDLYKEYTGLTTKQKKRIKARMEENFIHESIISQAIVDLKYIAKENKVVADLNPAFKKGVNPFWDGKNITEQGEYFIQKSLNSVEQVNRLDAMGAPIKVANTKIVKGKRVLDGTSRVLTGDDKYAFQQLAGGHISRKAYFDEKIKYKKKPGEKGANFRHEGDYRNANDKIGKYYNEARKVLNPEDIHDVALKDNGIRYFSPDEMIHLQMQAHYEQIAQVYRSSQYQKFFEANPAMLEKYGAKVLKTKAGQKKNVEGLFDIRTNIATGRSNVYEITKKDVGKVSQGEVIDETSRIFDSLFFQNREQAENFARQADVLLESRALKLSDLTSVGKMTDHFKNVLLGETGTVLDLPANITSTVTSTGRLFGTGLDVAGSFLYGLVFFGKANSEILKGVAQGNKARVNKGLEIMKVLGKAQYNAFKFLGDQKAVQQRIWRKDRADSIRSASVAGVVFNQPTIETFEALHKGGIVNKLLGTTGRGVFEKAERIWRNSIDEIKIGTWEALTKHLDPVQNATELRQIAEFINKGMGTLDSAASGVGKAQRQIESSYLFFSPRMTRSIVGLLGDAVTMGGRQGQLAREGAIGAYASLQAYTWAVGQALGQEVNLNPFEPNYMQVKLPGVNTYVGPGGQIVSLPRAFIRLLGGPDDMDTLYQEVDANGDFKDQPWFKFIRSRAFTSPGGSMLTEAITNENYFGEPYEGVNDFAIAQTGRLLPFWAQAVTESVLDESVTASAAGGLAEFAGLRSAPETVWGRNKILLNEATKMLYPDTVNYYDLDPIAKKIIREELSKGDSSFFNRPEVEGGSQLLKEYQQVNRIMEAQRANSNQDSNKINEFYDELEKISAEKDLYAATELNKYKNSNQNTRDRRKIIQDINKEFARRYDKLYDPQGEYKDVLNYLSRLDTARGLESPESVWITSYKEQVLYNEAFDVVSSDNIEYFDYQKQDQMRRAWIDQYGTDAFEYVRQYFAITQDLEPDEKELKDAREYFSYYWDASELAALEDTARRFNIPKESIEQYHYSKAGMTEDQKILIDTLPEMRFFNKRRKNIQDELRKNNQALDGFIYRWNYSDTLLHPSNKGTEGFWTDKTAIDLTNPNHLYSTYNNN